MAEKQERTTDAVRLPLGFGVYPTDGTWADDARALLQRRTPIRPAGRPVTLLADRVHAGAPLLTCLDDLGWGYGIRRAADTGRATDRDGGTAVRHLRQRHGRLRVCTNVRIGKGSTRRATVCRERHRTADGTTTTWYLVTNLAGEQTALWNTPAAGDRHARTNGSNVPCSMGRVGA